MNKGKILRGISSVVLALGFVQPTTAVESSKEYIAISHKIGTSTATVDGKIVKLSVATEINQGTTFIFCADLGKLLGIKFPWSPNNRIANGLDPLTDTILTFTADSDMATIDGDKFKSSSTPYIKNVGKERYFMLPLRFVCHVFGYAITANGKSIQIDKPLSLTDSDWVVPEGGMDRTYCALNGHAPKGRELIEDMAFKRGNEETDMLYFDGKILSSDDLGWTCYDAQTKKVLWKKECDDSRPVDCLLYPSCQLAYSDGVVVSGIGPTALDANTGDILWKIDTTDSCECVAFDGIMLAIRTTWFVDDENREIRDVDLYCFQVSDGKLLWTTNLKKKTVDWGISLKNTVAGNGKFLLDWKVYETSTGKHLFDLPGVASKGQPQIQYIRSSDCFLVSNNTSLKLYSSLTGTLMAEKAIAVAENVAVKNDRLYLINSKNVKLTCLDAIKLVELWSSLMDPDTFGNLAVSGYQAICANHRFISGYGLGSGKLLWKQEISKNVSGYKGLSLAIFGKSVYITSWLPFQKLTTRFSAEP